MIEGNSSLDTKCSTTSDHLTDLLVACHRRHVQLLHGTRGLQSSSRDTDIPHHNRKSQRRADKRPWERICIQQGCLVCQMSERVTQLTGLRRKRKSESEEPEFEFLDDFLCRRTLGSVQVETSTHVARGSRLRSAGGALGARIGSRLAGAASCAE